MIILDEVLDFNKEELDMVNPKMAVAAVQIDPEVATEKYRFISRKLGKTGPGNEVEQALAKFAGFGYALDSLQIYEGRVYMALSRALTREEQGALREERVIAAMRAKVAEHDAKLFPKHDEGPAAEADTSAGE
jgi:hypothetical protein